LRNGGAVEFFVCGDDGVRGSDELTVFALCALFARRRKFSEMVEVWNITLSRFISRCNNMPYLCFSSINLFFRILHLIRVGIKCAYKKRDDRSNRDIESFLAQG
jgi:hypothetical protein